MATSAFTHTPVQSRELIEKLCEPFPGEQPGGESLRYEGTYDRIKEARRADDPDVTWPVPKAGLKKADWKAVTTLCLDALGSRSKDLQLAAWLMEAWLQLYGCAGLRDGLALLKGLCERLWPDLHPPMEGDDLEARLAPFEWIEEKLTLVLKQTLITNPEPTDEKVVPYTWLQWERAMNRRQSPRDGKKNASAPAGEVTAEQILVSASLTPTCFYTGIEAELEDAITTLDGLRQVLARRGGKQAPSLRRFEEVLQGARSLVQELLEKRQQEALHAAEAAARAAGSVGPESALSEPVQKDRDGAGTTDLDGRDDEGLKGEAAGPVGASRPLRNRAEAYRLLAEAVALLRKTDPRSPVPYLIQWAMSWGHLTRAQALQELASQEQVAPPGELEEQEGGDHWEGEDGVTEREEQAEDRQDG